jgi:streptogramin lyase
MATLKRQLAGILALICVAMIATIGPALAAEPLPKPLGAPQLYDITEYPVPTAASAPYAIVAGPDQGLWFTERTGGKIGRLNPATGSIVEYPIPTPNSGPSVIVVGAGGNLRFTEYNTGKIGRITLAGAITELQLRSNSGPLGITSRPSDGSLWIAEFNIGKVARLSPGSSNVTATVPISLSVSRQPYQITTAADGRLWFTERGGYRIGRTTPISPTKVILNEYLVPTPNSEPFGITVGPDQNVWFTEFSGNQIGRITPNGTITEFPIPSVNSGPMWIARGPDGNLWFTEFRGNKIGRITPSGTIAEFPLPNANSGPRGIVTGPDGNIWFAEADGNRIGRLLLAVPAPGPQRFFRYLPIVVAKPA